MLVTKEIVAQAIAAGNAAPAFTGYVCCARVYIQTAEKIDAKSKKIFESTGLKIFPRPHGRPAIYLGYDNANGQLYGKAVAMAASLSANGISCYEDADQD